ncbi:hypothetical protein BV20DRAFT_1110447 [Pilatotrama ljubarskyi]|nr:hypothetical protein BV20DRAFT_1110447 [Pilatotrama ljubarskyi]
MPTATLNADIISLIASFAPRCAIPTMMQASRIFYHEGPKALLRDGAVLETDEDIVKFVRFIRAEDGSRSRYLTRLNLAFTPGEVVGEDSARLLARCLQSSSFDNLRILSITAAEETFGIHACLLVALKTLSTVQDLAIDECGVLTCTLVRDLGSSMRSVMLAYDNDLPTDAAPIEQAHPLALLQNSCDNLESLDITFMSRPLPRSLYPPSYPKVHAFSLGWCWHPDLSPYVHAFPNLRSLTFDTMYDDLNLDSLEPLARFRLPNRMAQLQHGSWRALDRVHGTLGDVYVSGLTCPVRDLELLMKEETYEMLCDVLNDTRPSSLSLSSGRAGALEATTGLLAVLETTGARNMKALKLDLNIPPEDKDMDVSAGLEALLASLKDTPLQTLELAFTCYELPERMTGERFGMESALPLCPVERYLEDMDLDAVGRQCLSKVPTLEVAKVMVTGHRTCRRGASVVRRADVRQDQR